MTNETGPTVATTIRCQLGSLCLAMLGAHAFSADAKSFAFLFKGCRKFNGVKIKLQGNDLYELHFFHTKKPANESVLNDIGVEQIHETIENMTGLYTRIR